jgi:hypothetical protein
MEEIAQRGGIITKNPENGLEGILLPDFFDLSDRRNGQCSEIAAKVVRDLQTTGWLDQVNQGLDANAQLTPYLISGDAQKFFDPGKENHMWAGLGQENGQSNEIIAVDGSFQTISAGNEQGYKPYKVYENPRQYSRDPDLFIQFGDLDYDTEKWAATLEPGVLISMTAERDYALCLSFTIDRSQYEEIIRPIIMLSDQDGETNAVCNRQSGGQIVWGNDDEISDAVRNEAEQALVLAENIPLKEDSAAAQRRFDEIITIKY